jgi:hypothetical protein
MTSSQRAWRQAVFLASAPFDEYSHSLFAGQR